MGKKEPLYPHVPKSRGKARIFDINALDGFWVSKGLDRTLHITFEAEDVLVFDLYDTVRAAHAPVGEPLAIVHLNLRTGDIKKGGDAK